MRAVWRKPRRREGAGQLFGSVDRDCSALRRGFRKPNNQPIPRCRRKAGQQPPIVSHHAHATLLRQREIEAVVGGVRQGANNLQCTARQLQRWNQFIEQIWQLDERLGTRPAPLTKGEAS